MENRLGNPLLNLNFRGELKNKALGDVRKFLPHNLFITLDTIWEPLELYLQDRLVMDYLLKLRHVR